MSGRIVKRCCAICSPRSLMSKLVTTYTDLQAFADDALPFLMADEARHNLQLGVTRLMLRDPTAEATVLATLRTETGGVAGVASMNPGHNLLLSGGSGSALEELSAGLESRGIAPGGVFGPRETAELFARIWCTARELSPRTAMRQGVFVLHRLRPPPPAPGRAVVAMREHQSLVMDWLRTFHEELELHAGPPTPERVAAHLEAGDTVLWLSAADEPLSLAGITRESPRGSTVGFVYTPRAQRGRGYAGSAVARLCRIAFDRGKDFCTLYADLDNPTSTGLYRRLGFELLVEAADIAFEPRDNG